MSSLDKEKSFIFKSPIGNILIVEKEGKISTISFIKKARVREKEHKTPSEVIKSALKQLDEYFHGKRTVFDIPILMNGTDFEKKVWKATQAIPFGNVKTYSDIAEIIGKPKAYRAVANALGKNDLVIVIPCHRVTAKGGLGGFSAGLWRKKWLLKHEGINF